MPGEGLIDLARRYVALSDQLEEVRGQIKQAVLNGGLGEERQGPFLAAHRRGPLAHPSKAREAEGAIVELLKARPGLKTSEIARATGSVVVTTQDRLRRLKDRGAVQGGAGGGWTAATP